MFDSVNEQRETQYDIVFPRTYGGAAGTYLIRSPWNADCEACITMVSFMAAGAAFLAPEQNAMNNQSPPILTSSQATDLVGGPNPLNFLEGMLWQTVQKQSYPMLEIWVPMGNMAGWQFSVGSGAVATITVVFRRARDIQHALPPTLHVTDPDQSQLVHTEYERQISRGRGSRGQTGANN